MSQNNKKFFDIHCHAFNLSHAGLLAFLNRFFLNNALSFKDLLNGRFFRILIKLLYCRKARIGCWLGRIAILGAGIFLLLILGLLINPAILGIDILKLNSFQMLLVRGLMVFILFFVIFLAILTIYWIMKKGISTKIHNAINLLSLMENDLGRQFLYLELDVLKTDQDQTTNQLVNKIIDNHDDQRIINQVRQEWEETGKNFKIDNTDYTKVVLTPLMMDFNYKDFDGLEGISYNLAPRKPIIDQVVDLYNGMKDYMKRSAFRILEIYPFLGINPKNYELGIVEEVELSSAPLGALDKKVCYLANYKTLSIVKKLNEEEIETLLSLAAAEKDKETIHKMVHDFDKFGFDKRNSLAKMLHKYFGEYEPRYENFESTFKSNFSVADKGIDKEKIQKISNYFFSGIKVYPPLGFDPWPEDDSEFRSVNYLFQFCSEKGIPITTHCSDSGFMVIERKSSWDFTSPARWSDVLREHKNLKLNFAHFGSQSYKKTDEWCKMIIELIIEYDNVYADFSYRGVSERFYKILDDVINSSPKDKIEKLKNRVLFGSDFLINLIETESYGDYLVKFITASEFTPDEKLRFCTNNPERYLFV